ncbi:MAG TPA: hypothetical protein VEC99_02450, partial [Clostridia bacterium]|nr:hypothetical protein [Clostridia bacterium]
MLFVLSILAFEHGLQRIQAQPANQPLHDMVVVDGGVFSVAETNQVLYIGGLFSAVGRYVGGGAPVSASTGEVEATFPKVSGSVSTIISDGAGGWYVGGSFTAVGGLPRNNLAHIRSDRSVDPQWHPSANGGFVKCLVLSGNTLYAGGSFTNVDGQARNRLAAVNASSGELLAWNPSADATVHAMVADGSTIYIGGEFTILSGKQRYCLAAVDANSGQPTAWAPSVGGSYGGTHDVMALLISGRRLFVGGYFTSLGGQVRSRLGSFDLNSGTLESWNPNVGTDTIYVGGVFSRIGNRSIVNLAAVDASTGLATSWDARASAMVSSGIPTASVSALAVYSNALYVGGMLGEIGGRSRSYAAALDLASGNATDWDPKPNFVVATFCGAGNSIYLGGDFGALNTVSRTNAAAFDLVSRRVTSWNPSPVGASANNIPVNTLLIANDQVFIGGSFTNVGGQPRTNLAAVDLTTGAVRDWNPNPNFMVVTMARWNERLYVGGSFTNISGRGCTNLAEFNLSTGELTTWDAGLTRSVVRALAVSGNTLYAGGIFRTAGGQPRRGLAAFDLSTGTVTPFDVGLSGTISVEGLATVGTRLYVCGRFNVVGGANRTNYFGIDTVTGQLLPAAHADNIIYGIAATSDAVFLAGNFSNLG